MPELSQRLQHALSDRYRIERSIGRGGMATVYLAEDLKHHRRVAIKVLDPEVAASIGAERFLREIQTIARLTHPHILPLHDSGVADGLLFYVMPFVEGESLRHRLEQEKQLPVEDALRITREVARALDYAHGLGIVHRDIKPENILLESGVPVVADFGIARAAAAVGGETLTATGMTLGTPAYMSPEQTAGRRDVDRRSDLYSLSCVLYEMLTGQPPFTGPTAEGLAHQHLNLAPRPVTELRPAVPAAVAGALQRALAKLPADRFDSVALFGQALDLSAMSSMSAPVSGPPPASLPAPGSRHTRRLAAATALIVALIAIAAWQRWGPFEHWLGEPRGAPSARKDWILVAEFHGPPGDTTIAPAARSLLSAALDQSRLVATVPETQIRFALQLAGRPTNTRVDAEVARELAYRTAVRAVLEGDIERIGDGFSVVLRVVDAESLKVVLTERGTARNTDALIPALGRLAQKLRAGLGENRSALRATRSMTEVATPSFEAYQVFLRAQRRVRAYAAQSGAILYRQALGLDPDFAMAWAGLAMAYSNLGMMDSCLTAEDEALRRPQRLTTTQRLKIEATRAGDNGDVKGALAAYREILQENPADPSALSGSAYWLTRLGRFGEAFEAYRLYETASPFGVPASVFGNEIYLLIALGRFDEARRVDLKLSMPDKLVWQGQIEFAASNWAAAESLSAALLRDSEVAGEDKARAIAYLAAVRAVRGELNGAVEAFERAQVAAEESESHTVDENYVRRGRLMLSVASGGLVAPPPDDWAPDSATATLLTRGLRAAIAGDRVAAQRWLSAARSRPPLEMAWQGATPTLLEAQIAALNGRWDESARLLEPVAAQPVEVGMTMHPAGMTALRWHAADAYEKLGRQDSMAACLERVVSSVAPPREDIVHVVALPFVHLRLASLYARMGQALNAERHLAVAEGWLTRPDPGVRRMIEDARAAVGRTGAVPSSGRSPH